MRDIEIVFLSVCPSDCLSHCGMVSKRMYTEWNFFIKW